MPSVLRGGHVDPETMPPRWRGRSDGIMPEAEHEAVRLDRPRRVQPWAFSIISDNRGTRVRFSFFAIFDSYFFPPSSWAQATTPRHFSIAAASARE
jgi:hypothetical protein